MPDKGSRTGGFPAGIGRPSPGGHPRDPGQKAAGTGKFSEGLDAMKDAQVNAKPDQHPSAITGQLKSSGADKKPSVSKDEQVVVRLSVQVAKDEVAATIEELRKVVKMEASFEVPQSSLPIRGIVKWDRKIVGGRVQKWVAVTAEGN